MLMVGGSARPPSTLPLHGIHADGPDPDGISGQPTDGVLRACGGAWRRIIEDSARRPDTLSVTARSTSDDPIRAACPATCPRLPNEAEIAARLGLAHRFVEANGLRFHVVEAGQAVGGAAGERPLVLLLHGFPELWYGWRHQLPALAERFRVATPDLRGYNLTTKPASGYDFATLASDVPALIRALGAERAHVVGHDWGGAVAWCAAMLHPEVIDRLAILNAPHPAAFLRELARNPRQWLRSWYIALFQVPGMAEWLLTRGHARGLADMLRGSTVDARSFSAADLAAYRRAMLRPGAARATLAYYRALRSTSPRALASLDRVRAPTLVVWGLQDVALVPELTDDLERWVASLRVERIDQAGHWVQHERPELVNRLLLEHLAGVGS
jgi:pimeloyl-ACP methyl ester carboxylesterase